MAPPAPRSSTHVWSSAGARQYPMRSAANAGARALAGIGRLGSIVNAMSYIVEATDGHAML